MDRLALWGDGVDLCYDRSDEMEDYEKPLKMDYSLSQTSTFWE